MTETGTAPAAPRRKWNPWRWVLVVSLALNVLFVAAGVTRFIMGPPPIARMQGSSYLRMIPRHFLATMEKARVADLLGMLKDYRDKFRDSQDASRDAVERLARALEATPYDDAEMKKAIAEIDSNGAEQVQLGTEAAQAFIEQLTADERKQLAGFIRQRAGRR